MKHSKNIKKIKTIKKYNKKYSKKYTKKYKKYKKYKKQFIKKSVKLKKYTKKNKIGGMRFLPGRGLVGPGMYTERYINTNTERYINTIKWDEIKELMKFDKNKNLIQQKIDTRHKLLDDFFSKLFNTNTNTNTYTLVPNDKNFFEKVLSTDNPIFNSYKFKEHKVTVNETEVVNLTTAGTGLKVNSDIDFDFQILPETLIAEENETEQNNYITNAKNFVNKVLQSYNKNIAFAKCFDTNFYFSMYFWHPFDINLKQLQYYTQAIYYKIMLRYELLNYKLSIEKIDLNLETESIFNKYNNYKRIINDFYKLQKEEYQITDPDNEYKLYELYCKEFINYLNLIKKDEDVDNLYKTKILCRMLLLQPESYVFPYTTASVKLELPGNITVSDSNGKIDETKFLSLYGQEANKHKNFLKNIIALGEENVYHILIVEYLSVFENLSDLIYNLKGKYLLRSVISLSYTINIIHFINSNRKDNNFEALFITKYLNFIKSTGNDKYISPYIIQYIYKFIQICTIETCSSNSITLNINNIEDNLFEINNSSNNLTEINKLLKSNNTTLFIDSITDNSITDNSIIDDNYEIILRTTAKKLHKEILNRLKDLAMKLNSSLTIFDTILNKLNSSDINFYNRKLYSANIGGARWR